MGHPLVGCWLKIERAYEHINNVQAEAVAFAKANPYNIRQEYDEKAGQLVLLFTHCVDLPPRLSILIGEALYQARSALDHLVWQLIIHNEQPPPPKSGFPIFTTPDGYKSRGKPMVKGMAASAEARIQSLQPYCRGTAFQDDPLWILQEMNNADKHRLLVLTRMFIGGGTGVEGEITFENGLTLSSGAFVKLMLKTPIEEGAELARFETTKRKVKAGGHMTATIMVKKISSANAEPAIPLLTQLTGYVRGVIDSFAPEFT